MALNFLKRKKNVKSNILLIYDSNHKKFFGRSNISELTRYKSQPKTNIITPDPIIKTDNIPEEIIRDTSKIFQLQAINHDETIPLQQFSSNLIDDAVEFSEEEDISGRNWEKAKTRIVDLVSEISNLIHSDDLKQQGITAMTELPIEKTPNPNQIKINDPQANKPVQNSSKLPLDIQELKLVSSIAKHLRRSQKLETETQNQNTKN